MTTTGPHATDKRLHPRVTVARAVGGEGREIARRLGVPLVDPPSVLQRAAELAGERSSHRAAAHARLEAAADRARHDLDSAIERHSLLSAAERDLREGAAWARRVEAELPQRTAAVEAARAEVEARQGDQRTALTTLDRVLEQRAAASSAMADAERQLRDLGVAEMDESGLRRELEASGHAVRAAREAATQAEEAVERLRAERAEAAERRDALADALRAHDATAGHLDPDAVARVRSALEAWDVVAGTAWSDPSAAALADAWSDLQADLAGVVGQRGPAPDPSALAAAEQRVQAAAEALSRLEAAAHDTTLRPEERAEIDEAHDAVAAAAERTGRRVGGGGARRALERARAREAALLERHGFASYLDVVLTGGRARHDEPQRFAAEQAYRSAVAERERLVHHASESPELDYLDAERSRLLQHCRELLGVDPGDDPVSLLREHPELPPGLVDGLRSALAAVGIEPVGTSLPEAARWWLAEQDTAAADRDRWASAAAEARAEVEELTARVAELDRQISGAEQTAGRAVEELELATASVSAFESELSIRVDEDARRLQRFAAAEQLRTQVEALSATLGRAEVGARESLEQATAAMAEAESKLDRASAALHDIARRARLLMAELPLDHRPEGDPLASLPALADALGHQVDRLRPDIDTAARSMAEVRGRHDAAGAEVEAAPTGLEGPLPVDTHDAFLELLAAGAPAPVVLDDPFTAVAGVALPELCDALVDASRDRPVVLLTADADVLSWAIELPHDVAGVVPLDALNLEGRDADHLGERAIVELTDGAPDSDDAPTTSAHRAGRR